MQNSERVMVIGGGIGGLTAAAALKAGGILVEVFERQPALRELGTGVGIQRVAAQALSMLGLRDELRKISGPGFEELQLLSWRDGHTMAAVPWHGEVVAVHRGELLEILARAVDEEGIVHCGMECTGFRQDASSVTALFADGHEEHGAALVAADGLESVIRAKLIGDGRPRYSGATVWRALPEYEHKSLGRNFAQQVYGPASIFGMYPVDERLFWWGSQIRPEGAVDPPIGRKQDLLNTFAGWPAEVVQVIEATPEEQLFRQDLYDRKPLKRWRNGRVTLLGDAAHPTTPTLGQGAGMAIEDGVVLGRELSAAGSLSAPGAMQAALDSYERKRIPRTTQIVDRSAKLAKLSHVKHPMGLFMRERVLSAMPQKFWQLLWEQERTYQIQ